MFCSECGKKLSETDLVCPNCGTPRDAAEGSIPPEAPPQPAAAAPVPPPPPAPPATDEPGRRRSKPERRGPYIGPLVSGIVMALLGIGNIVVEILKKTLSVNDVITGIQMLAFAAAFFVCVPAPKEERKGLPKAVLAVICVVIAVALAFVKHIPGIPTDDTSIIKYLFG